MKKISNRIIACMVTLVLVIIQILLSIKLLSYNSLDLSNYDFYENPIPNEIVGARTLLYLIMIVIPSILFIFQMILKLSKKDRTIVIIMIIVMVNYGAYVLSCADIYKYFFEALYYS